jgi:hypothetical protein
MSRHSQRRSRPQIEPLENRQLLSSVGPLPAVDRPEAVLVTATGDVGIVSARTPTAGSSAGATLAFADPPDTVSAVQATEDPAAADNAPTGTTTPQRGTTTYLPSDQAEQSSQALASSVPAPAPVKRSVAPAVEDDTGETATTSGRTISPMTARAGGGDRTDVEDSSAAPESAPNAERNPTQASPAPAGDSAGTQLPTTQADSAVAPAAPRATVAPAPLAGVSGVPLPVEAPGAKPSGVSAAEANPTSANGLPPATTTSPAPEGERVLVRTGDAPATAVRAEADVEPDPGVPQGSGLLSQVLPVDAATLQQGLDRFLHELDEIGGALVAPDGVRAFVPWVLAVAVAGVTLEVLRRRGDWFTRALAETVGASRMRVADLTWSSDDSFGEAP